MATQTQNFVFYHELVEPLTVPGTLTSNFPAPINLAPQIVYNQGTFVYESYATRPALPQPFIPANAPSIGYQIDVEYPDIYQGPRYNAAVLNEAMGSQFKGLYVATPVVFPFRGDTFETAFPFPQPHRIAQASTVGQVAPVNPIPFVTNVVSVASYFQQVFPQQEFTRPWPYGPVAEYIAYAYGTVKPIPFVPSVVTGVPWYVDNIFLMPRVGALNYLIEYNGAIQPVEPLPFVPPPPPPCLPPQPDPNTILSWFYTGSPGSIPGFLGVLQTKGGMGPTSQTFSQGSAFGALPFGGGPFGGAASITITCCICNSGLPCFVRSDYAIWCPGCCSFVPKQFTRMGTTQAPGQLRTLF